MTTTTPHLPIGIDEEKERTLINKFLEYRQFKVNWVERDSEGWFRYREKNYSEVILPVAIKSNIVCYMDEYKVNISFNDKFIGFIVKSSHIKKTVNDKSKLLGRLALIEYYTTIGVANYLGLSYEEFYNLPSKDPDKLKMIFDLGELVHRLINSDYYEHVAVAQEEQRKEREEFRKRILKK